MEYSIDSQGPVGKNEVRAIYITTEKTDDPAEPYYEDHKDAIQKSVDLLIAVLGTDSDQVDVEITGRALDGHTPAKKKDKTEFITITVTQVVAKEEEEPAELKVSTK